jgi:cerevisin
MKITLSAPFLALLSSITVTIASPLLDTAVIDKDAAPLLSSTSAAEHEIPNNYIVIFKKHVDYAKASDHHSWVANMHESSVRELRKRSQTPLTLEREKSWFENVEALVGLKHTYNISGNLMGYSGAFDDAVLNEIRRNPDVSFPGLSLLLRNTGRIRELLVPLGVDSFFRSPMSRRIPRCTPWRNL